MFKVVGDYQLTEKIGKGNFADVYLGISEKTNNKYAVKVISKETFSDPRLVAGLDAEIKIMKEFSHTNIVRLFKYFSSEKNYYLVVEYCSGGDLNKYIKKNGRLPERQALLFLAQLTEGLSFLHEKNFIHRDLKPANVLLSDNTENAVLKLADFGFARHLSTASLAQTRCGTPLYMAPEILEARDYDSKADIWSLGCIFYEMLVGTCPFKGTNETDLLQNIRTQALRVPSGIPVSQVSIDILVRLLERSSSKRASIDQLARITRRILAENDADNAKIASTSEMKPSSSSMEGRRTSQDQLKRSGIAGLMKQQDEPLPATLPQPIDITASPSSLTNASRNDLPKPVRSLSNHQLNEQEISERLRKSSLDAQQASHHQPPLSTSPNTLTMMHANPPAVKLPNHLHNATKIESPVPSSEKHSQRPSITGGNRGNPLIPISLDSHSDVRKMRSTSSDHQQFPPTPSSNNPSPGGVGVSPFFPGYGPDDLSYLQNQQTPKSASFKDTPFINYAYPNNSLQTPRGSFAGPESFGAMTPGGYPMPPPPTPATSYGVEPSFARSPYTPGLYIPPPQPVARQSTHVEDDDFVVVDPNNNSNPGMFSPQQVPSKPQTTGVMSGLGYTLAHNISNLPANQQPTSAHHNQSTPYTPTTHAEPVTSRPSSYTKGIWDMSNKAYGNSASSYGQHPPLHPQTIAEESNEMNESLMFFKNLLERCEMFCDIINVITNIADHIVTQEQQTHSSRSGSSTDTLTTKDVEAMSAPSTLSSNEEKKKRKSLTMQAVSTTETNNSSTGTAGASSTGSTGNRIIDLPQLQREDTVDVSLNVKNVNESIDRYLNACSLYFHALTILKNLIVSLTSYSESAENQHIFQATSVLTTIQHDLNVMFDQLLGRSENCQRMIDELVQLSPQQSYYHKVMIPKPELLLIQEASRLEQEASMEDLLGNLPRSANLYMIAKKLVNGATMTYSEEDQRKVQNQLKSFSDNVDIKLQAVQHKIKQMKSFPTAALTTASQSGAGVGGHGVAAGTVTGAATHYGALGVGVGGGEDVLDNFYADM